MTEKRYVLLGAGGHGKVLLDMLQLLGLTLAGVCDPALAARGEKEWRGVPVLGDDEAILEFSSAQAILVNGIGSLPRKEGRFRLHEHWARLGYRFSTLVHPAAICSPTAVIADGVQVMAGAILQADARCQEGSIINTKASIDHDCSIGAHAHIAPGVTLCGGVSVGHHAFVGAGTVIAPGVNIGERALIGAGSLVLKDVPAKGFVTGLHG